MSGYPNDLRWVTLAIFNNYYGLEFVLNLMALLIIYENNETSTCVKTMFLNSQTPKLRFFVLCFGFNQ